jgi:hypothetical protein
LESLDSGEKEKIAREIFEAVLRDVKKSDCSRFKLILNKTELEERERKFMDFVSKNNFQGGAPLFKEGVVYTENRSQNPQEGLKDILSFYLKTEDSQ